VDLAVDACFAQTPRDELGDLGAEIDDQDGLVLHAADLRELWHSSKRNAAATAVKLRGERPAEAG
jgi:hypothetical protein